jgi:AcrR family transcriptional regulator
MSSLRNSRSGGGLGDTEPSPTAERPDDALLDAARASILAVGWKRSTLTDVARRAGVSRMTIYRRWPDMQTLLGDLMTREWSGLVDVHDGSPLERLAGGVASAVTALRGNELFAKIVHVDPELLLPYLLDRRGRTQDGLLALLEATIAEGQRDGSVRGGDPVLLARSVLLATYGFALSVPTMTDDRLDASDFETELRSLVERYLHA